MLCWDHAGNGLSIDSILQLILSLCSLMSMPTFGGVFLQGPDVLICFDGLKIMKNWRLRIAFRPVLGSPRLPQTGRCCPLECRLFDRIVFPPAAGYVLRADLALCTNKCPQIGSQGNIAPRSWQPPSASPWYDDHYPTEWSLSSWTKIMHDRYFPQIIHVNITC